MSALWTHKIKPLSVKAGCLFACVLVMTSLASCTNNTQIPVSNDNAYSAESQETSAAASVSSDTTLTTFQATSTSPATTTSVMAAATEAPAPRFQNNIFTMIDAIGFFPSTDLMTQMKAIINSDAYRTGFYLKSLDGGSIEMGYNPGGEYFGASTIKSAVALYIYREVAAGRMHLDAFIGIESIGSLLERMLNVSANDAYATLRDYVGSAKINALTSSLGCRTFQISSRGWAQATPIDAAILWQAIYDFCSSCDTGKLFMDQLINAQWNEVKDALGDGYTIPHKYGYMTGSLAVYSENSLILKTNGQSYIFTYYTTGTPTDNTLAGVVQLLDQMMIEYDIYKGT
ncbi:MAG: class A beta-lactamase-related serine hydrolase [Oscillospiraceae bacterium]|nr:class A beta-lactamase-related serine hydrolase [Oscillospiraceae bacterium]